MKRYDCIPPGNVTPMPMDCAVVGKIHMHVYFENGVRMGCRFWDDDSGVLVEPIKEVWEAGMMWSSGPWRHTVTLQKFVDGILGK